FTWANSLVGTTNFANWILENTLSLIFLVFLVVSYKKHQFSDLSYLLICAYMSMDRSIPMLKIRLDTGCRTFFIRPEIITTVLYILVLAFYWPILCVRCF